MAVYYLLILYIFLISIFSNLTKRFKLDNFLLFSVFAAFILVAVFRDIYVVGKDIPNYLNTYYQTSILEWKTLLSENRFEPGYLFYNKLLSTLNLNESLFIAITSFLILLGPYYVIKNFSSMPFLSWYIYITLGFFAFGMSGLRNALAISVVFLGFGFLLKKKYYKYLFVLALSISIHKVGFFLLLALPFLIFMNPNYKNLWIYFLDH